ncbi:MAG TPA: hypothetical protein ENJ66_01445 [Calditrichae bacterium]|nr:hypothetical protein [Calditrichia bacterium]
MKFVALIGLFIVFSVVTCERITQPTISKAVVELVPEAVMVTEAWFSIKTERPDAGLTVALERDGKEVLRFTGLKDTVVADSGLQPGHGYTYRLRLYRSGKGVGPTPPVSITTLDTTSHDIEWTVYDIPSPYGSGVLYDVAIVDENDIWAVGEIYSDSNQTWLPYNAVHWDGKKWELGRVYFPIVCGQNSLTPYPSKAVLAFDNNEIWISSSGDKLAILKNGKQIDQFCLPRSVAMSINKMWGIFSKSKDFYICGYNGLIGHFDGEQWHRIESGTDLPLRDIWGVWNIFKHRYQILAIGSDIFSFKPSQVLEIFPDSSIQQSTQGLPNSITGIWGWKGIEWYISGDGVYYRRYSQEKWDKVDEVSSVFTRSVRGMGPTDVFVAGDFGYLAHWNGKSWYRYTTFPGNVDWYQLAVSRDIVVAVGVSVKGFRVDGGVILMGHR